MTRLMIAQLEPWSFQVKSNFHLRGWHTPLREKPILFFLHGNGFCGLTYSPMLNHLAADFDLIIMDLPGHGDSDSGGRFMGWNRCADLALSVFNHFASQISPAIPRYILGHSFGGVISALMMGKEPRRFDKAMLMDPVIFPAGMVKVMAAIDLFGLLPQMPMAKQAKGRKSHWLNRDEVYEAFHERGIFKGWSDDSLKAHIEYAIADTEKGVILKCSPRREAAIFASYPKRLWSSLERVRTQTKVLVAEKSFPFIARSMERLDEHRFFEREAVRGGHCFMMEDPKNAANKVKAWFLS